MTRTIRKTWLSSLWLVAVILLPRASIAITLNQTGYTATSLGTISPAIPDDLELDSSGNLYFACGTNGIQKVTPAGAVSPWSGAPALDLTFAPADVGYGAGRSLCHCISSIQSNGSYSPLYEDSHEWTYVALIPDGTLYSSVWVGTGQGLYQVNRSTGQPTVVVAGGPGPGGSGIYAAMTKGSDGKLYVLGSLDGSAAGNRLFRLDGTLLVPVAAPPHGGSRLAPGPSGKFFVATAFDYGSGYPTGEVWIVDSGSGESSLLATSGSYPGLLHPTFSAVGYDAATGTVYVSEYWNVWAIKKDPTPAIAETWGAVKARYRGPRVANWQSPDWRPASGQFRADLESPQLS